jgi:predicted HicB family RNase H-like nuclease
MIAIEPRPSPRRHRAPGQIVQVNLRIDEAMRRRLQREAKRNRVSLNREMKERLKRSLAKPAFGAAEA